MKWRGIMCVILSNTRTSTQNSNSREREFHLYVVKIVCIVLDVTKRKKANSLMETQRLVSLVARSGLVNLAAEIFYLSSLTHGT